MKVSKKQEEKDWSLDEVDRLLSRTEKPAKKDDEAVVEKFARTMRLADTVSAPALDAETSARVSDTTDSADISQSYKAKLRADDALGAGVGTGDILISSKTAKQRVADIVKGMKKKSKASKVGYKGAGGFDEPLLPKKAHSMETDENRRRFLEVMQVDDDEEEEPDAKTKVVERAGFIIKKGESEPTGDLEGVPRLIDAEDIKNEPDDSDEEEDIAKEDSWDDRQMRLSGFDAQEKEQEPEQVSETEAEKKLLVKRREKIDKFKLMGIAEAEEENRSSDGTIEKLFSSENEKTKKAEKKAKFNPAGVEYTDEKNAARIRFTLHKLKRVSAVRFTAYCVIAVISAVVCAAAFLLPEDYNVTLNAINLVMALLCVIIGANTINRGVATLLKREPDLNSALSIAAMAALVQSICAVAIGAALGQKSFSLAVCGAVAFAAGEYGEYLRHARTYDAFNFCTGRHKNELYSVQEIENPDEEFEIGRNLLMDSPDIRYSCRMKFPSRLIGKCENSVSSDKLVSFLMPISAVCALVCAVISAIMTKNVFDAVTAAAGCICICAPSFGLAAIQLPLRWANKRLNKAGGMIADQNSVEDYSRANAVVVDSAALFDPKSCRMHGFRDFKTVRVDDIMLYSAAMVVKSGGPLTGVFDQVVSKRELLPEVHSFAYEDRMGISGWINGQKVIMGNRNMMKHHNLEVIPYEQEQKYTHDSRKVIYVAIANSLAAMLVVSYAPDKRLIPFIRRLGDDGVTVLLRNNDSNITADMINETFGVKFKNIRIIGNTAGRIYKKHRRKVKETSKSGIIHDGKAFSLFRSFTMSYTLCGTFKVENLIQLINVIAGFILTAVLCIAGVLPVVGALIPAAFQCIMIFAAFFTARLRGIF